MLTKSRIMMLFVLCLSLLLPENSRQSALAQTEDDPQAPTQKIFLPIIQGGNDEAEEVTAAASWGGPTCTNVAVGERALWFDSPGVGTVGANNGPGNNNEAGLFWFLTNSDLDEKCSYEPAAPVVDIDTNFYSWLRVVVAVNDGARFKVELFDVSASRLCDHPIVGGAITTDADKDDGGMRTYSLRLPANKRVCNLRITLDDDANNIASTRASALIDDIRIWDGSNLIGWRESFSITN